MLTSHTGSTPRSEGEIEYEHEIILEMSFDFRFSPA